MAFGPAIPNLVPLLRKCRKWPTGLFLDGEIFWMFAPISRQKPALAKNCPANLDL
jgi:hypothetical protein